MTKDNWTEIICILDRSGSMRDVVDDTIGGFNAFLDQQKQEAGRARLTLVLFDDEYEVLWKHVDLANAADLDNKLYFVRGSTALLDAVGKSVSEARGRINQMHADERPGNVIVLVMTDGYENASQEYDSEAVKKIVAEVEAEGWDFVFVGADIDAFAAANDMAVGRRSTTRVSKSADGMREAYSKLSRAVSQKRRTGKAGDVDAPLDEDGWL